MFGDEDGVDVGDEGFQFLQMNIRDAARSTQREADAMEADGVIFSQRHQLFEGDTADAEVIFAMRFEEAGKRFCLDNLFRMRRAEADAGGGIDKLRRSA